MTFPARLARGQRITVAQQLAALRRAYPGGRGGILRAGEPQWDYEAQPTPISRVYQIRIRYQIEESPKIYVISPNLRDLAGGKKIPHLYDQALQRLCLYLPRTGEWNATKWLVDTVIPWVDVWLYFFEDWLQANEWRGGGEHPPEDQRTKKRKRAKRRKSVQSA